MFHIYYNTVLEISFFFMFLRLEALIRSHCGLRFLFCIFCYYVNLNNFVKVKAYYKQINLL
jgi:uncharacterized membrane protein YesL